MKGVSKTALNLCFECWMSEDVRIKENTNACAFLEISIDHLPNPQWSLSCGPSLRCLLAGWWGGPLITPSGIALADVSAPDIWQRLMTTLPIWHLCTAGAKTPNYRCTMEQAFHC